MSNGISDFGNITKSSFGCFGAREAEFLPTVLNGSYNLCERGELCIVDFFQFNVGALCTLMPFFNFVDLDPSIAITTLTIEACV